MFTQQIRKAGNSYVVTIPKSELDRLQIDEGSTVAIELTAMEHKPVLPPDLRQYIDDNRDMLKRVMTYLKDK
jgi:antitoxin component of MazEF toxin-antitoxin module